MSHNFAEKGCTHFNLGADEYANDKYTTGAMGFGQLQSRGQYADYIAYVNNAAAIIKEAGMTPMAFNDGIYFNNVTSSGTFDSDIAVCFWTAGLDAQLHRGFGKHAGSTRPRNHQHQRQLVLRFGQHDRLL